MANPASPRFRARPDVDAPLYLLALALIAGGQFVGVTAWLKLNRIEMRLISDRPRLAIGFLFSFGLAGLLPWTTLGRAVTAAEPERAPRHRRRVAVATGVTLVGVLCAFTAFMT
jgi:hypothetical protein